MMEIRIRQARETEYEDVRKFYYDLIDALEGAKYHPKWQKGIYPEDDYLESSIRAGELYIVSCGAGIAGALIADHSPNNSYDEVAWPTRAADGEVTVIHALGVCPELFGQGIGQAMVEEVIRRARETGQKAIRLDVIEGNLPAEKLYRKLGFQYITSHRLFYEDTGWYEFHLYEYRL